MIKLRERGKEERGLSLVETLAAILVFSIVTIGIVPLLASSIQGTALARSYTVGKEVARQATERVRGLPFYISYDTISQKADVLDMYLPCADPALNASSCQGQGTRTYWDETAALEEDRGVFQIECDTTTNDAACAVDIPQGYTLTFRTRFVQTDGVAPAFAPGPGHPDGAYGWDVAGRDAPESDLVHMAVTASWDANGRERTFDMHTLVGDRKIGDVKVAGNGRVHYGVQALTRYRKRAGLFTPEEISDLSAVIGLAESRVESRLVSAADQRFRLAGINLIAMTEPEATDLAQLTGAVGAWRAPPAFAATSGLPATPPRDEMNHPSIAGQQVAYLHDTQVDSVEVRVDEEQPIATGEFSFPNEPGNLGYVRVQAQKPEGLLDLVTNPLRLDWNRRTLALTRGDSPSQLLDGGTEAVTGKLGTASRRVETGARVFVRETQLFPVTYIGQTASFRRSVVQIQNFDARVNCNAKGTSATATAEWTATIRYWNNGSFATVGVKGTDGKIVFLDPDPDGNVIATVNGGSDLQTGLGGNVLLHSPLLGPQLWLFDEPEANRRGYFTSFRFAAPATATDGAKLASADINDAISITTVPPNPDFDESALVVSLGKLSCRSLDNR